MTIARHMDDSDEAAGVVYRFMPPTPQYAWPLLGARVGAEVWVKHENHLPFGAFKIRGGVVFLDALRRRGALSERGVVAATRGNHGQSVAFAARAFGVACTIFVPEGNSPDKNRAMEALGARLVVAGHDFQAAYEAALGFAAAEGSTFVPSFHEDLVRGVATYAYELFRAVPDLATVFVPIGLGSGICGTLLARDACGSRAAVVGVVTSGADAYARSFEAGRPVATERADTGADGLACRVPVPEAVAHINAGVERIVRVDDAAIAEAMRAYFDDTHSIAEGAGAAPLAALLQERERHRNARVAVILCGGNVARESYTRILAGSNVLR